MSARNAYLAPARPVGCRWNRFALLLAMAALMLLLGCRPLLEESGGEGSSELQGGGAESGAATDPDLVVRAVDASGVSGDWQTLAVSGTVSAEIANEGVTGAPGGFDTVFFEDVNGNGAFDAGTDTELGRVTSGSLASGASDIVSAPVMGTVSFRDNLIHAFVDADDGVAEADEGNNLGHSGEACAFEPPVGVFEPVVEWHWSGSSVIPASNQVMMTPAVADLNDDGIPDVVFSTFTGANYFTDGHLRAVSGADGSELWTVTDPAQDVRGAAGVAVGDIDGDGRPEVIAGHESGNRLMAFEHDGTFKWIGPPIPVFQAVEWGSAALADLDADGTPEIVIGATVMNADGTIRWTRAGGQGNNGAGPLSAVADLDLDGAPEVVAGNTAYKANGTVLWQAPVGDGFPAVADFDSDGGPEVVLVSAGLVRLLDGMTGTVIWSTPLPGGGRGGAPTVADFDSDGDPEVGVAGAGRYVVFETDGTVKWASTTQDFSSNVTGSSVFDFEGDGSAEVIYSDELFLRIYSGVDGTILFQTESPSGTTYELPVLVDVDADGNAEIVMVSNNYAFSGPTGVRAFGDAADNWVNTRRIWNQHTYHVTNVNDDGSIPTVEVDNWLVPGLNHYRLNSQGGANVFAAPDLTASFVRIEIVAGAGEITARIGNGGGNTVGAGVPVSFYEGDPATGGTLLGTVATSVALAPGEFEDVTLSGVAETVGTVWVVADDAGGGVGTANECDETNNVHDSGLPVSVNDPPVCDLAGPSVATLWPPNHGFVPVEIKGVTDPNGDPLTLRVLGVTSDEPTATAPGAGGPAHAPDAVGLGTAVAELRAERSGPGDGRVYVVSFEADDGNGGSCSGSVSVGVPHDQGKGKVPVDSGQAYDATQVN